MFSWLKRIFQTRQVKPAVNDALRLIHSRYDAAVTSDANKRHWEGADNLSANAANSPEVRRILRTRARYEIANNSYARGIVLTLANDTIGTGPRLQMLTSDAEANRQIERAFQTWSRIVCLPEKLRTMRMARAGDGEGFALLSDNPRLISEIKLDLRLLEADQVATSDLAFVRSDAVDGIVLDTWGNPVEYHVLKHHPGDTHVSGFNNYARIPAASMLHYYRADRPGQIRGIPDITAALALFAMLRDYSLATLDAAKAAAYFAGIIYTDAPAGGESDPVEPMDQIELERNMLLTMPGGWKMSQLHAEQPSTGYAEFKREILNEIARCFNMPFGIAAGNSSGFNYASGRLDHQTYYKSIRVEQSHLEHIVLDPLLAAWFDEAALIPDLLPTGLGPIASWSHQWFWDGHEHVDPAKEANAQKTRLASHTTTLADEYARRGQDWETQLRQRAKEQRLLTELGLLTTDVLPQDKPDDESDEAEEEAAPTAAA